MPHHADALAIDDLSHAKLAQIVYDCLEKGYCKPYRTVLALMNGRLRNHRSFQFRTHTIQSVAVLFRAMYNVHVCTVLTYMYRVVQLNCPDLNFE